MDYTEEILSRADFSIESRVKDKVYDRLAKEVGLKVRDISFDDLVKQSTAKAQEAPEEKRTKVFRELVKEGAAKRKDLAAAQMSGKAGILDTGVMNNDRAIIPQ